MNFTVKYNEKCRDSRTSLFNSQSTHLKNLSYDKCNIGLKQKHGNITNVD